MHKFVIKKKEWILVLIAFVAILGVILSTGIFVSVDKLCEQGKYVEAYKKASSSEKDQVLAENIIAVLSEETSEGLKDPSSFTLRKGYYYPFINEDNDLGGYAILYSSGTNSYGATVSDYTAYLWSIDDQKWDYWGSCETYSSEDDDGLEEFVVKLIVETGIEEGIELTKTQVNNINKHFEENLLDEIELIELDIIDRSRFSIG